MNKYCPAGKCECEKFITVNVWSKFLGACKAINPVGDISAVRYEVCPYPSRQVRLENKSLWMSLMIDANTQNCFNSGRTAGIDAAIGAVKNVCEKIFKSNVIYGPFAALDESVAAISALKEEL
jgi:hypothetical protein